MEYSNTYVKIDLDAILANFRAVQQCAGAGVMAVIKADAYGHGAVEVAKLLEKECDFFGVSSMAEALELRAAGIGTDILILGHTPAACFADGVKHHIRLGIFDEEEAKLLSAEACRQGKAARVHLVVDTGMSRIGFQVREADADACARIAAMPGIFTEGLYSHFATADMADQTDTLLQVEAFDRFFQMLKDRGLRIPLRHIDNSAGVIGYGSHYEMVRAGIVLYGLYPSDEVDREKLPLTPAMSWHTTVSCVKLLEPGRKISYGGTYETTKPTLVATIPAGYADGYRRSLSGKFYVLIRGRKAPILGRICMDQFMVDVTDIPGVQTGDPVVLMGRSGEEQITVEALSQAADSFCYEQICDISRRVTRVYTKGGQETGRVNYLLNR